MNFFKEEDTPTIKQHDGVVEFVITSTNEAMELVVDIVKWRAIKIFKDLQK